MHGTAQDCQDSEGDEVIGLSYITGEVKDKPYVSRFLLWSTGQRLVKVSCKTSPLWTSYYIEFVGETRHLTWNQCGLSSRWMHIYIYYFLLMCTSEMFACTTVKQKDHLDFEPHYPRGGTRALKTLKTIVPVEQTWFPMSYWSMVGLP